MPDSYAPISPPLTMLWESTDPVEALTRRFRFESPTAVTGWLSEVLAQHWDLAVSSCERLVISSGNIMAWITVGERQMIAKWSMHAPSSLPTEELEEAQVIIAKHIAGWPH